MALANGWSGDNIARTCWWKYLRPWRQTSDRYYICGSLKFDLNSYFLRIVETDGCSTGGHIEQVERREDNIRILRSPHTAKISHDCTRGLRNYLEDFERDRAIRSFKTLKWSAYWSRYPF